MRYSALYIETAQNWAVVDSLSCDFALELFNTEKSARLFAKIAEKRWNLLIHPNQLDRAAS